MRNLLKLVLCISILATFSGCKKSSINSVNDNNNNDNFQNVHKELFVATNGDNSIAYEDNDIDHPWATIEHGVYQVKQGDVLYVRGGTYTPQYKLLPRWDYGRREYGGNPDELVECESGTEEQPVIFTNYQNEEVIVDCNLLETYMELDGRDYWIWEEMTFINAGIVFSVGENAGAFHCTFRKLNITRNRGGDNAAGIKLIGGLCEYTTIENCKLVGPGTGSEIHQNTCGIYLKAVNNIKLLNNEISNFPIGIYYKHQNADGDNTTDLEIAYNFIENTGRNGMNLNCNYANVHDNILGVNNKAIKVNSANGAPGGDYNIFEHNTIYSGGIGLSGDTQSGDERPGALNNTLKNNIFLESVRIHVYSTTPHNTTMDYNFYSEDLKIQEFVDLPSYTLSEWQTHYQQDQNSIEGTAVFIGGDNPTAITDFVLANGSPGKNKASDGTDIGADISKVGIDAGGTTK